MNYGRGHLNAGGTGVVTFLMLAKQCGAEIDDSLLHRTLTHFFRYAGRGINPYGDRAIVTMLAVPQGIFQMWLEERALPPLDADAFRKAAAMTVSVSARA